MKITAKLLIKEIEEMGFRIWRTGLVNGEIVIKKRFYDPEEIGDFQKRLIAHLNEKYPDLELNQKDFGLSWKKIPHLLDRSSSLTFTTHKIL